MGLRKYANNVTTKLTAQLLVGGTTVNVTAGDGALFAAATGGDYIIATLRRMSGFRDVAREIVKITARSTDALTITRAQESTSALQFEVGDQLDVDFTAASLDGGVGGVPAIAAIYTNTGLTAALGSTAAFTLPAADGWYEVSVYLAMTTAGSAGTISQLLQWTDADSNTATAATAIGQTTATTLGWSAASGTNSFKSAVMKAKASTAINISTTFSGVTGSPVYNLYVVVKRL